MRKLSMHDAFAVAKLLKKANMKEEIERIMDTVPEEIGENAEAIQRKLGIDAISTVIMKCAEEGIDNDFYEILSSITGKDKKELEFLPIEDMIEIFKRISKENNLSDFFKLAVKSMR